MNYKYSVKVIKDSGKEETRKFKTQKEICQYLNLPLYLINKIIKRDNDIPNYKLTNTQMIYKDVIDKIHIDVLKKTIS
jgi:hypothetical protein